MTQQEIEKAMHQLDGYYLPRPGETVVNAFLRAKTELLHQLAKDIDCVTAITSRQFAAIRYKGTKEPDEKA